MVRLGVGLVPEGEVEPGWTTIWLEGGPRVLIARTLGIGVQAGIGALDMNVGNRHRVIEGCRPEAGCLFEAPAFEEGWGSIAGAAVTGSVEPLPRVELTAQYGVRRILSGANADEVLQIGSVGLQYRFR